MALKVEYLKTEELTPYAGNAKLHPAQQIEQIKKSIEEFGFNDPIAIWGADNTIIEGHGRLIAAEELGIDKVPVIRLDELTDEQRKAYTLVHNKLTMNTDFSFDILQAELEEINDIDMTEFGFDFDAAAGDWFEARERDDKSREEGNEEYNSFLEKFEAKKTTDDCYTPDLVYNAIAEWVTKRYGAKRGDFLRPFFPGGDYQSFKYPSGGVVVDNPPFSILSEIIRWYSEREIKFFLFAPALTLFSSSVSSSCAIPCGASITYENGAKVSTSFVTNLEGLRVHIYPDLYREIEAADQENQKRFKKSLPKYKYPNEVLTAAMCDYICKYGVGLEISRDDSQHIRQLDCQKEFGGVAIFGSGYLLSEKAAAEKAAAEKAAAEKAAEKVWALSEKEKAIVRSLGNAKRRMETAN